MRKLILLITFLFMVSAVQAFSFGTMVESSNKTVNSLSAEYEIHLLNLGEEDLEVELELEDLERADHSGLGTVVVEPSEISEEPVDDWIVFDGSYVEPQTETFEVVMDRERESEAMDFQVDAEASLKDFDEGEANQEVIQEREHSLYMETRMPITEPQDREESSMWQSITGDDGEDDVEETEEVVNQTSEDANETYVEEDDEDEEGGNILTFVLVSGILLIASYIYLY